jgi:hypothetical protein
VTILEEHGACIQHEITDRVYSTYRLNSRSTTESINQLFSANIIDREEIPSPYSKDFHFYFLSNTEARVVNSTIHYKLDLLQRHSQLTQEIGKFGEDLIGRIVEELPYDEVEVRKKKHGSIGLGRKGIDVWGKHVSDYYQHIEVKNRRQPVNLSDIEGIITKTETAHNHWNLPIESALVCPFIYGTALEKANFVNMPVAITEKIFVPQKYASFYREYSRALGSYYFEIADSENPSNSLSDLILDVIHDHNYDC